MSEPRTHPSTFRGVTFWPRPVARSSPVDRDVLCETCGYNLRGLAGDIDNCPECGTKFDRAALRAKDADQQRSQLPWKQRRAVGFFEGYYGSIRLVLLHPRRFALEIWQGGRLGKREANAFRWITIAHAFFPLLAIALATIGPRIKPDQFLPLAFAGTAALLLWLHKSTRLLATFFQKQTMPADVQSRVIGLAHFTSAALVLSPVHLLMLALAGAARKVEGTPLPGMLSVAIALVWAVIVIVQIVWWWISSLRLVKASMRCNEAELIFVALTFIGIWALQAALYLGLLPFLAYKLVNDVLHL